MAIRPAGAVATPPAPAEQAQAPVSKPPERADGTQKYTDEERKVHGQVRMHALIAGYKVAAQLAPTIATVAAEIRTELKKLAHEVAEDIEAYSFLEAK